VRAAARRRQNVREPDPSDRRPLELERLGDAERRRRRDEEAENESGDRDATQVRRFYGESAAPKQLSRDSIRCREAA
jgi:hypothetical protein